MASIGAKFFLTPKLQLGSDYPQAPLAGCPQAELEGMCSQVRTWERDKYAEIFCMGEINFSHLALI
ncbi:protein of unknown function [Methylotuvimicrobium alcaliphilum 20Z]|uniref:Uncharacterized protein n=1 Tax=Methylotuvimicrobium alcaliphilum (strain DSM 19304 / NCIMB 14124 / VKM B-2133 / 20Z) TaxID=1091494 RepID=G4T0W4_META2|nr:protein of unknown function [Methylotuvimicrobium alcaliphilum 20Z]